MLEHWLRNELGGSMQFQQICRNEIIPGVDRSLHSVHSIQGVLAGDEDKRVAKYLEQKLRELQSRANTIGAGGAWALGNGNGRGGAW